MDALLSRQDVQEGLSRAYVMALAAKANYVTSQKDFDRDGVDITIEAGGKFRPKIDLQLKATQNLDWRDGKLIFPCPVKNYEKLIIPTQTPRLLLIYKMPKDENMWLGSSMDDLTLRHCAYWVSLLGNEETNNKASISIEIDPLNRLTVNSLKTLMEKSRRGILS